MSNPNLIDEVLASSPNRRSLLKKLAVAGAALGASQLPLPRKLPRRRMSCNSL